MQEIAVIQRLQAQVVKLLVTLGVQGRGEARQVEIQHVGVEEVVLHALGDVAWEVGGIGRSHVGGCHILAQDFARDGVQQQPCGHEGVVRFFFDQGAGCQDGGLENLIHVHAIVQIA
ncbi:hypothetical protein D3C72_943080 [compost metagenome]